MKWEGEEQSDNVEDRRSESGDGGGGFGGLGIGGRHIGLGSIAIALVAGWVFGINPLTLLGLLSGGGGGTVAQQPVRPVQPSGPVQASPEEEREVVFTKVVLRDTEKVWGQVFQAAGGSYAAPKLDLFRGRIQTACGTGQTAQGPFYCPGDRKVYIDLSFFDTLSSRLGAPGEFARAYVIAHEVGHHVQNLMGITGKVDAARSRETEAQAHAMSVRVELQADCLAGVWAHHSQQSKGWLDAADIESALNAASQIGDDTLQRKARGTVVPESFTHGSSQQRVSWFQRGYGSGKVKQCNTFEARL
jgi:predicted metalloprotease